MKRSSRLLVLVVAAGSFALTGCGNDQHPAYSALVKYGVRQDPILMQPGAKLGDERYDPDRPGQFPIMKLDDITKPDHPLFIKSKDILATGVMRDPTKLSAKDRDDLDKALEVHFGTPAKPTVKTDDAEAIKLLKLDDATLAEGSKAFRIHCLHCHGVPGDGRGPTARWINPHPRDFRQGIFKFQSVNQSDGTQRPPHRGDLLRTLRNGIEGTAMPTFNLLKDQELENIVSYVIHLSLRGSAEVTTFKEDFDAKGDALVWKEEGPAETIDGAVKLWIKIWLTRWKGAQEPANAIKVAPYPWDANDMQALEASVQRGQVLFTGNAKINPRAKDANCVSCHTDFGRQAKFRFDDWGTLVRPNNFTLGVFRGGKRPVDMYYRVHSGINGSGMVSFGNVLKGDEIWDLVNFVSNMAYPGMRESLKIKIN
jgi:mono/diheme cytochrome c family protein